MCILNTKPLTRLRLQNKIQMVYLKNTLEKVYKKILTKASLHIDINDNFLIININLQTCFYKYFTINLVYNLI